MKRAVVIVACGALWLGGCAPAESPPEVEESVTAFVGARLFDGTDADVVEDAVLVVRDGRILAAGSAEAVEIPEGAERVDVSGKTIVPGLISAHAHVSDVRGLERGHYTEENILRQLGIYARYGITTVVSLGDDGEEGVRSRDAQDASLDRARLFVAGEVVTGDTVEEVQAAVDENVELGVDFIKIRVDDNLGTTTKMSPELYRAVIERAHDYDKPVASHVFYLEDAKALLEAGTDFIAHSVRDQEVDDELVELLRDNDVCYCPTLTREVSVFVYESVPEFFEDPFFLKEVDPAVVEQLKDEERMRSVRENEGAQAIKKALEIAKANLKILADRGVTIAFGTDTGQPARFQGYFEHMEAGLMAEAGLSPKQILRSATGDAARCLGLEEIGTLESGNWADFIVLNANPLDDIENLRTIDSVWIAGNGVSL